MIRVIDVQPRDGYRLWVRFSDGLDGVYSVEPERRGGVFLSLLNPEVFRAVSIDDDFGCVQWPDGIDLCPTSMHKEMTQLSDVGERDRSVAEVRP